MYTVQPVFTNNFGGNYFEFDKISHAYECAKMLMAEEDNIMYVDITSSLSSFSPRMYKRKNGGFGFKQPWQLPEDEEGVWE